MPRKRYRRPSPISELLSLTIAVPPGATTGMLERQMQHAARQTSRIALRISEALPSICPVCGCADMRNEGIDRRTQPASFGRLAYVRRRLRCQRCAYRLEPAHPRLIHVHWT